MNKIILFLNIHRTIWWWNIIFLWLRTIFLLYEKFISLRFLHYYYLCVSKTITWVYHFPSCKKWMHLKLRSFLKEEGEKLTNNMAFSKRLYFVWVKLVDGAWTDMPSKHIPWIDIKCVKLHGLTLQLRVLCVTKVFL